MAQSCTEELTREQEQAMLAEKRAEIVAMADAESCTGNEDYGFTPLGHKACGGPAEYIAYSKAINESQFLEAVADYTAASKAFNQKWGVFSTCDLTAVPSEAVCSEGEVRLIY